ncbi:NAD(P)-binding protein [Saccharata proteae CBS 121410]|uniref:NAD(P)-binding protein n=1 Tax=Saccharata proteae CBS 121410 TaxID=1314787 RepID=A0A9P4M0Q0_9PEZI|nr:NAD(P)-binding protein [Saccharata proteae CBS 121410]
MPAKAPTPKINIAVVGLGRMGKRHCKTLMYRVPHANLVAVCTIAEVELSWARSFFGKDSGVQVFDSYTEMINMPGLHAVWVSTSTDMHASQSIEAINKSLHVLCEKPLSQHLDEARAVVQAAKAKPHLKVMAGYSRRFDASYRDAKAKVDAGAIGKPFVVRSQTCDLLDNTGFFVRYARKNGAIFVDCCIHDIDLSIYYLGDVVPKAVWAVGALVHHPELAESNDVDNGIAVVEYWGGKMAYFYCSRTMAHGHDVATEIVGTKGKLMVNVHPRSNNVMLADERGISNEVQPEYWERFEDAFSTEANEFCESILEDKPVPLPLELGLKSLEIGWALQEALWSGKTVFFNKQGQRIEESERAKL